MYLCWIDHHLCWVCKEDKLLWTGPPSIVKFSVAVTQRLTSCGEEISRRDLILTNASAPGETSTNQRPVFVTTDQSEARTCDKLFVNYWATVWSTYVTPSQATHSLTSSVLTLWLSINQLSGHRSQSPVQMQMIINADNLTLSPCSWIFTFYFGHKFTKSTRNYLQALFLKPFSVSFRK